MTGIGIDWTAFVGGGFAVAVLFLALVERLRRTFATRRELEDVAEQSVRPLERITAKLETVGEIQAAQAAALGHILQRLDRLDSPPSPTRTRRHA